MTCKGSSTRDARRSSTRSNPPEQADAARQSTTRHGNERGLGAERDRLASRLDEQEQAHNEAEQSLRHEVEQLRRASEQAPELRISAAASRAESLGRQVAAHEDDLRRQRLERRAGGTGSPGAIRLSDEPA